MAIQYPEWRKIGREESGVPDWAEALNKGLNLNQNVFKSAYTPRSLENEAQTKEQNLQRNAPYAQNAQRAFEADIGSKEANIGTAPLRQRLLKAQAEVAEKNAQDEFGGHIPAGAVGQAYWLDKIKSKYGEDSPYYQQALKGVEAEQNYKKATMERNQGLANSQSFRLLPTDEKKRVTATAVGMGYEPTEAIDMLTNGSTLEDMAQKKGVSLKDIEPVYPLANETIKQMTQRSAFTHEIDKLGKDLTAATNQYGRQFFGYSPSQVIDAIKNDDPETQGMFLAARALQPELNALRLKSAGGQIGIEALRHLEETALSQSKIFKNLVSPEARKAMQKYINMYLADANSAYDNYLKNYSALGKGPNLRTKMQKGAEKESNSSGDLVFNPKTGRLE